MKSLETLLHTLCPDVVMYSLLEEVTHYSKERIDISKVDINNYVSVENLLQNKQGKTTASSVPFSGKVIKFKIGDILIGNIRPYLRKILLADCNGGTNGDVLAIQINDKLSLFPKFLYCILSSEDFFNYHNNNAKGAKMPRGDKSTVMKYNIPLPPLEVQEGIVRILDKFTELTTELTARKKQYEFYHNLLLKFCNCKNMKWESISNLCEIKRGKIISKEFIKNNPGKYPVYSSQTENNGVLGSISEYMYDGEYVTWTTDGANAGTVFYRNGRFNITNICGLLKPKNDLINIKYLYFILDITTTSYINPGMGNPKLMSNVMAKIKIPLPPLEVQEEIVGILDKFDSLCNDLTSGIPAEIEARQKQYEYYRDKLLNFKKAN